LKRDWNANEVMAYLHKTAPELGIESQLTRTANCLVRSGIDTMEKLCATEEEGFYRVSNMPA